MADQKSAYFPSKRDLRLWLLVWGLIILLTLFVLSQGAYPVFIVMLLLIAFVGWIWMGTGYRIAQGKLLISNGPFRYVITASEIKEIRSTSNPAASPANSIDRLEIAYGQSKKMMISPADKANFIKTIKSVAQQIALSDDLKKFA